MASNGEYQRVRLSDLEPGDVVRLHRGLELELVDIDYNPPKARLVLGDPARPGLIVHYWGRKFVYRRRPAALHRRDERHNQ